MNLLEADTIVKLSDQKVLAEVIQFVPDAFKRYFSILLIALVTGMVIIKKDAEFGELSKKSAILIALVLGISLCWIALSRTLQFPICGDDSYIDFRYVKNWVEGISFDYNPGDRVIGFTSHIHLLLLYLFKLIFSGVEIDVISQMMNVFLQFINLGILYFFLKSFFKNHVAALAGIFAYAFDPYGIQQTVFGKETHILVCFLILSIWAMHRKRYLAVAWLTSLMPFIRPEAVVWWGLTLVWSIKENRQKTVKLYLAPLAMVVLIVVLMLFYFGTVIPHGMIGKFKMFYPKEGWFMFFNVLWTIGTGIFLPRYYLTYPGALYALSAISCGFITLAVSFKIFGKSVLKWYVFAVFIYVLIFGIKNVMPFSWYHCWYSLLPVLFLAVMIPALIKLMQDSSEKTVKRVLAGSALVYLIAVQLVQQIVLPVPNLTSVTFRFEPEFKRIVQFGEAYKKIQSYSDYRTATIGTPEIGYLGFIHPGNILDFCGLVSPEVIKIGRLPLSYQAEGESLEINPAIVEKYRPDYIITLEAFGRELFKDSFFQANYVEIAWLENNWAKSKGIFVYKLKKDQNNGK